MKEDSYHHIPDDELLQRFYQTNDNNWLGILLQRYTLLLLGVCMKYFKNEEEAKDGVQQIFLKVLQDAGKYKIDYFKSWLYMVARNFCLTVLREKKTKPTTELTDNLPDAETQELPIKKVTDDMLANAIAELNEAQKNCIFLFYLQKKSYQQITALTGYNMQQVKSYIQNGKRNLKMLINKKLKELQLNNGR